MRGLALVKEKSWVAKLKAQRNALVFPGVVSHIALKEVASQGPGASRPGGPGAWRCRRPLGSGARIPTSSTLWTMHQPFPRRGPNMWPIK